MNQDQIKKSIAEFVKRDVSELEDQVELRTLVRDSFLLVELVMGLQEDYGVRIVQEDLKDVATVGDLIQVFLSKA